MAHKILENQGEAKPRKKKFKLPSMSGRFGVSFMFGKKEVFVGFSISKIDESVLTIKRRSSPGKGFVRDV